MIRNAPPKHSPPRACGLLFCYNEEPIIEYTLRHYLSREIDLVVFDNQSTDSSMEIIYDFKNKDRYKARIIDVQTIATDGFEWKKILKYACDYMHKKLSHYDWILTIDADSFYYCPVKGLSLLEFLKLNDAYGVNILNGALCEFYPTELDDPEIDSPIERLKYCQINLSAPREFTSVITHARDTKGPVDKVNTFQAPQYKILRYHPSVDFYTWAGHLCLRDNPVYGPVDFLYHHYPWISYQHGLKKIFEERKPRYVERRKAANEHHQYLEFLPIRKDLVRDSKTLYRYDKNKILISRNRFMQRLHNAMHHASDQASNCKNRTDFYEPKFSIITEEEIRQQRAFVMGLPQTFHFLMTNFCNARCNFCNQDFNQIRNEIAMEKFKKMTNNIPMDKESFLPNSLEYKFYFSGGGEPFLNKDLISIIAYTNNHFPQIKVCIRTNGTLIKKYIEQLARLNIYRLEISVHGATAQTNSDILQIQNRVDVFKDIAELNYHLRQSARTMQIVFCPVVTRENITEIPGLVEKAADLNVGEVHIFLRRYFAKYNETLSKDNNYPDSLYYEKGLYNRIMSQAKTLADSRNIILRYEPLLFQEYHSKTCYQPWRHLLIDWEGDVYPCCGGEVWFEDKVKSGIYHFGNLLKEHLSDIWNSNDYVRLRRTCSPHYDDDFIKDCKDCHNRLILKRDDFLDSHFIFSNA